MRESFATLTAAVAATACNPLNEFGGDMTSRLKSGDTTVCAEEKVQEAFLMVLIGQDIFKKYLASGNEVPPFTAVSATAVNKSIGEVSCSAKVDMASGFMGVKSAEVAYSVRPSLDQGGDYVVESASDSEGNGILGAWLALRSLRAGQDQTSAVQPPTPNPTETAPELVVHEEAAAPRFDPGCGTRDDVRRFLEGDHYVLVAREGNIDTYEYRPPNGIYQRAHMYEVDVKHGTAQSCIIDWPTSDPITETP